jgi:hypothetical protein
MIRLCNKSIQILNVEIKVTSEKRNVQNTCKTRKAKMFICLTERRAVETYVLVGVNV